MSRKPLGLLNLFLAEKEAANVRVSTIGYYRFAVLKFLPYAPDDAARITPDHLRAWLADMRERGLKPGAIRSQQGAVYTWLRWLHDNDYLERNITRKVPMVIVRAEERTRRTATEDSRAALIECALARAENPYRDAALVEVLWSCGMRRSELAPVNLEDYDDEAGSLWLRHTKTGEPRLVAVGASARLALLRYLHRERGDAPGPLFLRRGRRRLSSWGIQSVIRSLALSAGVTVSAHDFRRATAARLLEAGAQLDTVMDQLGHDSPSMTLLYGKLGRQKRSLQSFHAIDKGVRQMRGVS